MPTWIAQSITGSLLMALMAMQGFLLNTASENKKNIAVINQSMAMGKEQREKAYNDNCSDHQRIFNTLTTLVSRTEMDLRIAEIKNQSMVLESALKQLEVRVGQLQIEQEAIKIRLNQLTAVK